MSEQELPQGWAWTTLGEVARYINGRGFKKSEWDSRGLPIIRIQNLTGTGDSFNHYSGEILPKHIVEPNDLLVSWAATLSVHRWQSTSKAALNQHIFKVEPSTVIDSRFLEYSLRTAIAVMRRSAHGSGMVHVTRGDFEATPIPLPPLPEQYRIVDALEDHLSRLDAADASLTNANTFMGSLHRTRPDPFSPNFRFPKRTLKSLLREPLRNGHSGRETHSKQGIRAVTMSAVTNNEFSEYYTKLTDTPASKAGALWLQDRDIFVQRSNTPDLVGSSAMYRGPSDWAIFPDLLIRIRVNEDEVFPAYLLEVLRSESVRAYFRQSARGLAGSMPKISQNTIESVIVPLPTIERQQQWVDEAGDAALLSAHIRRSIDVASARSSALRRSMLRMAFNGELVDQDSTDEPADVALARLRSERSASAPRIRRKARSAR